MIRFSCGCVAFDVTRPSPRTGEPEHLILWACNASREDDPLGISWRNLSNKPYETLTLKELEDFANQLSTLMADGHRYRELRALLRIP